VCVRMWCCVYRLADVLFTSLSQYSRLVQLCKDITASTCSPSNISLLLSSTDHSINKVAVWRNSVLSAINKLPSDYPMYPDVTVPLVALLTGLVSGVSTAVWIREKLTLGSEQVCFDWLVFILLCNMTEVL